MTPTQTSFWKTNVGKTLKALVFVAVSSALGYLIVETTSTPTLFGPYTILINGILVYVQKTWFDRSTPNLGA